MKTVSLYSTALVPCRSASSIAPGRMSGVLCTAPRRTLFRWRWSSRHVQSPACSARTQRVRTQRGTNTLQLSCCTALQEISGTPGAATAREVWYTWRMSQLCQRLPRVLGLVGRGGTSLVLQHCGTALEDQLAMSTDAMGRWKKVKPAVGSRFNRIGVSDRWQVLRYTATCLCWPPGSQHAAVLRHAATGAALV